MVYAFDVSTDEPQLSALSNFKADCLHQALSFLPKSSVDVRRVEVARAMRLTSNSIEPVTFRVPRLKVFLSVISNVFEHAVLFTFIVLHNVIIVISTSLKVICNDFLVVKVNCWSYVFNIMKYM